MALGRRTPTTYAPPALTASAARIRLRQNGEGKPLPKADGWQTEALGFRDDVPEIGYATLFVGQAFSKVRLYVGYRPDDADPNAAPIPVDHQDSLVPEGTAAAAKAELARLKSGRPTSSALMYRFGILIDLCGEAFLVGLEATETEPEEWTVRSRDEVRTENSGVTVRDFPGDHGRPLRDGQDELIRLFQSDARWSGLAWSPMRHLATDCRILQVLRQQMYAEAISRLSAGILLVANEFSPPPPDATGDDPMDDPFMAALMEALTAPVEDATSAASIVPTIVRGPFEQVKEGVRHLSFERSQIGGVSLEARLQSRVESVARGINLPVEVVLGHMSTTFANAGQIDEDTYEKHLLPRLTSAVEMLTVGFLTPHLARNPGVDQEWGSRLEVWFDASALLSSPDPSDNADKGLEEGAISEEAWRRAKGFNEEDAPLVAERLLRLVLKSSRVDPAVSLAVLRFIASTEAGAEPDLGQFALPAPVDPTTEPDGQGTGGQGGQGGQTAAASAAAEQAQKIADLAARVYLAVGRVLTSDEARQIVNIAGAGLDLSAEFVPFDPAKGGPPDPNAPEPAALPPFGALPAGGGPPNPHGVTASAATPSPLGGRLARLDRDVRARVQAGAASALSRALERAGNRVRAKAALRAACADLPAHLRAAHLGAAALTAAGLSADDLIDADAFTEFLADFTTLAGATQANALAELTESARLSSTVVSAVAGQQADALGKASEWIGRAMHDLAVHRLFLPDYGAPDPRGEQDLNGTVPTGLVRHALTIAGRGAYSLKADAVITTTGLDAWVAVPGEGEVATGELIRDTFTEAGGQVEGYIWQHGGSGRPLQAHLELDGVEFYTFEDDVLANGDSFPETPFYFPGDHAGCVPAGTVVSGPGARGATLRYHEGQLVTIRTASGKQLAATPNHPVLTDRGWIPIGLLHEGDQVVRDRDAQGVATLIPDDHQMPSRIENVTASFAMAPGAVPAAVPVASMDFHGDGPADGEVCVVWADRVLMGDAGPGTRGEPSGEDPLVVSYADALDLTGRSGSAQRVGTVRPTSLALMGERGEPLAFRWAPAGSNDERLLLLAAWRDPSETEALRDRVPVNAETLGESLDGLAGFVELDQVVAVDRHAFAGHVFNLSTLQGWYVADGILVHNCSCDFDPVMLDPPEGYTPTGGDGALGGTDAGTLDGEVDQEPETVSAEQFLADQAEADKKARAPREKAETLAEGAARLGEDPEVLRGAGKALDDVKQDLYRDAANTQAEAFRVLEQVDGVFLQLPPKGTPLGGEWDWLDSLSKKEQERLRGTWIKPWKEGTSHLGNFADNVADRLRDVIPGGRNMTVDELIRDHWLPQTRLVDAAGAVRQGRIPVWSRYSGELDLVDLVPNIRAAGYDPYALLEGSKWDQANHLLAVAREEVSQQAASLLGQSGYAVLGPQPWRMGYITWSEELADIEYALQSGAATEIQTARLRELLPAGLDEAGASFETLYARLIETAKLAGEDVADYAVIPWD